jgi:hypothetical protein
MRESQQRGLLRKEEFGKDERFSIGLKHELSTALEKAFQVDFNSVRVEFLLPEGTKLREGFIIPDGSIFRLSFLSSNPEVAPRHVEMRRTVGRGVGWVMDVVSGDFSESEKKVIIEIVQKYR